MNDDIDTDDGFPTVAELAAALRWEQERIDKDYRCESADADDEEPSMDVRLQVDSGTWSLHTGSAQYDTDHSGYWGAGILSADTDCDELAAELIDEAKEQEAQES